MTEEIKKIIFQLEIVARKHTIKVTDTGNIETMPASVVHELRLNNYSAKILLNYITNLQKENKDLKESNHNWQRKLSDYKQRNEKAIEYIKNNKDKVITTYGDDYDYETCLFKEDIDDLLNILQGGDE